MVKASDFEVKDIIGRGHFGIVQVVRERNLEMVYAMKVLRKTDILSQAEVSTLNTFYSPVTSISKNCDYAMTMITI